MSRAESKVQTTLDVMAQSVVSTSTIMPNGKGLAASPKLTDGVENVEMNRMMPSAAEPDDDIMQLARLGDIHAIQKLFSSGKFDATYCDEEGITPLHWAAINNQYAMCKFLLDAGADVNKKGGESVATPAMWAAQRCYYYTVHLLLQYGADPPITDVQGYNILHLATFEGNIFLLVLLLHQNIHVDTPDSHGHTCLMWAAYKGYPACVDLFLRWGADVHATDKTGFTALHWALVKGSPGCIQKLIEYGSDRFAKASSGKTPAIMAEEMKTTYAWHKALTDSGYNEDATSRNLEFPMSSWLLKDKRGAMARFFFFMPFLVIWSMIMIASHMVVFAGIPIALFIGYTLQWISQQVLPYTPPDMRHIHKTPWLAGIFSATLFFVGLRWLTTILPATYSNYYIINIIFAACFGFCGYFYFCTMFYEPGYVPKLGGLTQQKTVIDELLSLWKFDDQNFCVPCMTRKPLRSKHCKRCNRCVAKHDHHCPWVYNCIGVNNHRHFFLYLVFLELGIALLVRLTFAYFEVVGENGNPECNILAPELCRIVNSDPYTVVLMTWTFLQLTWITMLLFVQLVQISRAMTTYENMRGTHHPHGSGASEAITSALAVGTLSANGTTLGSEINGSDPAIPPANVEHHPKTGCFTQWKKLLGVDTFMETALHGYDGNATRRRNRNPFSRGCIQNCKDFWYDPAPICGARENGVAVLDGEVINYTTLYEAPLRTSSRARRPRDQAGSYEFVSGDDSAV